MLRLSSLSPASLSLSLMPVFGRSRKNDLSQLECWRRARVLLSLRHSSGRFLKTTRYRRRALLPSLPLWLSCPRVTFGDGNLLFYFGQLTFQLGRFLFAEKNVTVDIPSLCLYALVPLNGAGARA